MTTDLKNDALTRDEYIRLCSLAEANAHCGGRFEPAAVLEVAVVFDSYIRTGQNLLRPSGGSN